MRKCGIMAADIVSCSWLSAHIIAIIVCQDESTGLVTLSYGAQLCVTNCLMSHSA